LPNNITLKPVLLIVEDNLELLDFIAKVFDDNYTIIKATNGLEALEFLANDAVQLVISDIMMPYMDGFQLCKIIKGSVEHCHIPVILLTAKNTLQSKIEGLELGADAYIEKPFSPEFLKVQAANLLSNRDKLKDYFAHSPLVHIKSIAHSKSDEHFLGKLNELIQAHIHLEELDIEMLSRNLNMSKPTLYRKIKSISNLSLNALINITRLKKAAELLACGDYKIYEVAQLVGFNSQTSFGRNFLKQFGMSPSAYYHQMHKR
jgi:two-component system cell cycle response regulator